MLISLIFCSFSENPKSKRNYSDVKDEIPEIKSIYIGMSTEKFTEINQDAVIEKNCQWQMRENLFGLQGNWTYDFKNGELQWYIWDYYEDEINEDNFK